MVHVKKHPVRSTEIVPMQYIRYTVYLVQGKNLVFHIMKHNNIFYLERYIITHKGPLLRV